MVTRYYHFAGASNIFFASGFSYLIFLLTFFERGHINLKYNLLFRFVVSPAANEDKDDDQVFTEAEEEPTNSECSMKFQEGTPVTETSPASKPGTPTSDVFPRPQAQSSSRPQTPDAPVKPHTKLSHDWLIAEEGGHHLTIGPHPGTDWMRRLALDKTRKTSEPEVGHKGGGEGLSSCRSTDCIPKDSSSSDSDLLRSAPPWARSKFRFSPDKETKPETLAAPEPETKPTTPTTPTAPEIPSSGAGATPKLTDPAEIAAKKQRVKQSLMKRARSVAIFSLKLKERRAREGKLPTPEPPKQKEPRPCWGTKTEGPVGGELGCIPIEMLISVDDVAKDLQRRQNPST